MAALVPYLIGGSLSLLGVIVALWFRYKLAVAQGDVKGLKKDVEALGQDLKRANDTIDDGRRREAAAVLDFQAERAHHTAELLVHTQREEKLRALLQTAASPAAVVERLGELFPVLPKT